MENRFFQVDYFLRTIRIARINCVKGTTMPAIAMRKLTILVSEEFYQGLLKTAGPRKIGVFIENALSDKVATQHNLEIGYKAMAQDEQREKEAKQWLQISGETLSDEAW